MTLERLTKDELLEAAAEQEIEGRSSMTKDDLVAALEEQGVSLEDVASKDRLQELAADEDVEGRSSMSKGELADALEDGGARRAAGGAPINPTRPAQDATNPKTSGPPSRGDQPGLGRAANPDRDPRLGPTPRRPVSRVGEKVEEVRQRAQESREASVS